MNKIFVTGGAGFIGSNFIHHCLDRNDSVLNYDLLRYAGNLDNLKKINSKNNYVFVQVDICDANLLDKCINDFKYFTGVLPVISS